MNKEHTIKITVQLDIVTTINGKPTEIPAARPYIERSLKDALAEFGIKPEQVPQAYEAAMKAGYKAAQVLVLADVHSDENGDRWNLLQYPFSLGFAVLGNGKHTRDLSLEDRLTIGAKGLKQGGYLTRPCNTPGEAVELWSKWAYANSDRLGNLESVRLALQAAAANHIETKA